VAISSRQALPSWKLRKVTANTAHLIRREADLLDRKRLDALREYCSSDGRVCPQPQSWNELWESLPGRERDGGSWRPPPPLILGAWWHTSSEEKRRRLWEHVEWADEHGALSEVDEFLRKLPQSEWHREEPEAS
jgi:hypothetical protein